MGVQDGFPVSAGYTNPRFISKNTPDVMPFPLGFTGSGASIADIQAAVNKLYTATGASESTTGTVYNATAGTITNGQDYESCLSTLADKFDAATGHHHTGSAGDGPILDVVLTAAVAGTGGTPTFGAITFEAGMGMTITQVSNNFIFSASGGGGGAGVSSIAASGFTPLTSDVILQAATGSGLSITQSAQTIIFDSVGSPMSVDIPNMTNWQSYSLTIGAVTTPPTEGSGAVKTALYRRVGDSIEIYFTYASSAAGTNGSGTYLFPIPSGLQIDSSKVTFTTNGSAAEGTVLGEAYSSNTTLIATTPVSPGLVFAYDNAHLFMSVVSTTAAQVLAVGSASYPLGNSPTYYTFHAIVPIVGYTANTSVQLGHSIVKTAPLMTLYTSGSGTHTFTGNPLYVTIKMIGGGGGGAGSGTTSTMGGGGAGGDSTINSTLLIAGGGSAGGQNSQSGGGAGGSVTIGVGPITDSTGGSRGETAQVSSIAGAGLAGGTGGSSPFGGAGVGSTLGDGFNAAANSGSGGGGGGANQIIGVFSGAGGGSGGYIDATLLGSFLTGLGGSVSYSVGTMGSAGTAGTSGFNGGNGSAGKIIFTEYYQ